VAQVYRGGRLYGTGWLTPYEVRTREFTARRRGVDPEQVRDFQRELADDLTTLYQELTILNQENERLKRALRDWQSMHARHCDAPDQARPNTGHW
jgi:DivIVA domain-containing protein